MAPGTPADIGTSYGGATTSESDPTCPRLYRKARKAWISGMSTPADRRGCLQS